ncbi:MAG: hypothetical protein ACI97A_001556 [Planctomycetota bacterium]|jgi:hypothetical protein
MQSRMRLTLQQSFLVMCFLAAPLVSQVSVSSDFDDGTLGGWAPGPNMLGTLANPGSGGNMGGIREPSAMGSLASSFYQVFPVRAHFLRVPTSSFSSLKVALSQPDQTDWQCCWHRKPTWNNTANI